MPPRAPRALAMPSRYARAAKTAVTGRASRTWSDKSLDAREPLEEPAGVAPALLGGGVQQSRLDLPGPDAGVRQAADALVEERASEGVGPVGDRYDHPVEHAIRPTRGPDGVHGVRAVLADGEDLYRRGLGPLGPPFPKALPDRRRLGEPGGEGCPREARPYVAGNLPGEWALVVHAHADRDLQRASPVRGRAYDPSPDSRFSSRLLNTSISLTVCRSPLASATRRPLSKTSRASASSPSSKWARPSIRYATE